MKRTTRIFISLVAAVAFMVNTAWGIVVVPPPDLNPLNQTVVPEPPNLAQFVLNKSAAIRLGKALFWDMQVGSDGVQSCASCHFSAGADTRLKNTLNPGSNAGDTTFGNNPSTGLIDFPGFGPNYTLNPLTDFPLHERAAPTDVQSSAVVRDTNDVVGSQGVRLADFTGLVFGSAVDSTVTLAPSHDPVFNVGNVNTRRVTGRNTPTVINAIFNFNNFWDGRGNFIFNGENPFGPAAQDGQNPTNAAGVWFNEGGTLVKRRVTIQFASLASQATGPALDATEMSGRGRTFPILGRKMINNGLIPLGRQLVHPHDSALGFLSNAVLQPNGTVTGTNGLNTTYAQMITAAFQPNLTSNTLLTPNGFTQMEANFSLFWGLAVQLYVATLVSDQTPFDRWLGGETLALTDQQKFGFLLFSGIGNCVVCHGGIEFTNASATSIGFVNNFDNNTMELMFVSDGSQVLYDNGFNNTAIRPTTEDIGRGGNTPFPNPLTPGQNFPLSYSPLAVLQAQNLLPLFFEIPILDPFFPVNIPINANGLFKVPGLRNVELTAPYFHNGSVMTLEEAIDVYVRGGNFPSSNLEDLDPIIGEGLSLLQGREDMRAALVAFLRSLTDPRVANQSAPFDHPELLIPEGDDAGQEVLIRIAATDSAGNAATLALSLSPVISPTTVTTQTISGTVEAGVVPEVTVNTTATVGPVIVNGADWSCQISALAEGTNIVTVSAIIGGATTTLAATINVDTTGPALSMNAVITPTPFSSQTISGAMEAGATVRVSVNGGAPAPATVAGTSWSFNATLPVVGPNTIDVTATDGVGNATTLPPATISRTATTDGITVTSANGGEAWQQGTAHAITWTYSGNPGATVKIDLYKGAAKVKTLAKKASIGAGGNGSFNWTIRTRQAAGADYKIKVTVTQNTAITDMSDNFFTITSPAPAAARR